MIKNFIQKETTISIFLFILLALMILYPSKIVKYPQFIDYKTIFSLSGLILITTALKESGYFYRFSEKIILRLKTERALALFFVMFSMLLSTFMTNDITLFIVVPITLSLKKFIKNDLSILIIMEALAVNVGSALTPIGNPQNLFIWHQWRISFISFVFVMFPLVLILTGILITFLFFIFKPKKIDIVEDDKIHIGYNKNLFIYSFIFLVLFVLTISVGFESYAFLALFLFFCFFNFKIILKTDWFVILFFIIAFIDLKLISQMPVVIGLIRKINLLLPKNVFLTSTLFSQFMSNVPATIFMSNFTKGWFALSYGVNLAGNGFFIASLANVIALRMVKDKKIWIDFHKYSIAFFIVSFLIVFFIFFF